MRRVCKLLLTASILTVMVFTLHVAGELIAEHYATRITVHITDAVHKPGTYSLPPGSRVADAVQAAGGLDGADETSINLAEHVRDGMRLRYRKVDKPWYSSVDIM